MSRTEEQSTAPYDGKAVANLILDWASDDGIPVTPMKLQKLIYFCHAEFLKITGNGLVSQEFEAWDYGPVIPYIFHEFKHFSKTAISSRAFKFDPVSAKKVYAINNVCINDQNTLRKIYDFYKSISATSLSDLSHDPEGPWTIARELFDDGRNADRRISNAMINRFYRTQRPS